MLLGLFAGYVFELFENSDYIINRCVIHFPIFISRNSLNFKPRLKRDHGTSQFYEGDSKINVFGDILALGLGYSMSKVSLLMIMMIMVIIIIIITRCAQCTDSGGSRFSG